MTPMEKRTREIDELREKVTQLYTELHMYNTKEAIDAYTKAKEELRIAIANYIDKGML